MTGFIDDYNTYCETYGVPVRLELMLCDLNAVLRGKWLPGDAPEKLAKGAVRLPLSTYAPNILGQEVAASGLGIVVGDPDGIVRPIAGTLRPVPWLDGHVAQVQIELEDRAGQVSALDPRRILARVLDQFQAKGLRPVVATELEFYLFKQRAAPTNAPVPPDFSPRAQNFDLDVCARLEPLLDEILADAKIQGLATDTMIAEFGPGQFEINFHHTDDVLLAADTALLFRRMVRGVAAKHGYGASFMAKPYAEHPGNGMHVHASLLDSTGHNIFDQGGAEVSAPLGHAIAGVLATMRDMQAIFAPHLNSYRRFFPGSFAPSSPDWGLDHRGVAVRVPETKGPGARLEHRISGADVNPYLALTALLGGMLHGLKTQPDLPASIDDAKAQKVAPLTHDWRTAVEMFADSEFAEQLFGKSYRDIYAAVRRDEITQLTGVIAPIEYATYLGRL